MKLFPISAQNFLDFAKELIEKKDQFECNEVSINRTIVDRLYYTSFLHVRTWIEQNITNNGLKYDASDHGNVLHEINKCSDFDYSTSYSINSEMNNLRDYRNDTSYVLDEKYLKSDIAEKDLIFLSDDVDTLISTLFK